MPNSNKIEETLNNIAETCMADMKATGAAATIFAIHPDSSQALVAGMDLPKMLEDYPIFALLTIIAREHDKLTELHGMMLQMIAEQLASEILAGEGEEASHD